MLNLILSNRRKKIVKNKKINVAVFGGTFDPVHLGHCRIVAHLCEKFDKVIIVPAQLSPFKAERETASAADRINMLELVFKNVPKCEISDFEIKSGGISYSYLTARKFAAGNVNLTYVIGSDMLYGLYKWKNFDELSALCAFYVIPRAGFVPDEQSMDFYKGRGVRISVSDCIVEDISSSLIKVAVALDRETAYLDGTVSSYIRLKGLYKDYCYITDRYPEFGMKAERIDHTYRAVKEGIALAKMHDESVENAITAILLHDIGKYVIIKQAREKYGLPNIEFEEGMPEKCRHAPLGALIAKHCFGIQDESILGAIEAHTCGAPFMDDLAKIVFIADYIEEGRSFAGLDVIREESKKSLDKGMETVLKNTIEYLRGKDIFDKTFDTYDYFKIINGREKN